MEAFSLLKYWRSTTTGLTKSTQTTTTTTASSRSSTSSSDNDHGPYFDLEFALGEETPLNPNDINVLSQENETEGEEEELEVSLRISPSSSSNCSSKELSHSKIDKNVDNLVPIEKSSLIVASSDSTPKFSNNLLKSASKFRVLMAWKPKKLKENAGKKEVEIAETENSNNNNSNNNQTEKESQKRKLFTVKLIKVDEVPIVSLFTRDHSSKTENRKGLLLSPLDNKDPDSVTEPNGDNKDEEEKRLSKDVTHKYLKMVKPLYVRASKRYGDKMRFSGEENKAAPPHQSTVEVKGGGEVEEGVKSSKNSVNFTAGLRVVLGKSKSASAVPVEAPPRRDDSLIQQQDGIQSAIMHCKRSFNASTESPAKVVATSSTEGQIV